jgi:hypothetical protein
VDDGVPAQSRSTVDVAFRRVTAIVLALFLILIGGTSTWNIVRQHAHPQFWTDFTADYVSAKAHLDGLDPYGSSSALEHRYVTPLGSPPKGLDANPHPPAHVTLAIPLARLSFPTARAIWVAALALSFAIALGLALKEMGVSWFWAAPIAIGCLWLRITRISLLTAQIDGLLLLLITLGWLALRRGRERAAGISLGIATALKFFPAFLLLPLLRSRRLQAARWHVGCTIVLTVATSALFGQSAVWTFLRRAAPENLRNWAGAPHNLSLTAIPLRWLLTNHWRPGSLDVPVIAFALVLGIFMLCAVAAWSSPAHLSGDSFLASIPWMLLATPLFWPNELVLVLPLISAIALRNRERGFTTFPWPLLAAMIVAWGSPRGFIDSPVAAWSQVLYWMAATYALMWIALNEWFPSTGMANSTDAVRQLPSVELPLRSRR